MKSKQSHPINRMGGPNRRYVPAIDVLKKLDNHQIWNQYHKVEILIGAIESINPSALLLLYGSPGNDEIKWRLELSKDLHRRFETTRKTAVEVVSTLNPQEALDTLEEYYDYLFEDYDFTVSPVCSKMQAVAVYLFWEKYKEVQLVFPMPLGYSTDRKPKGVSDTYLTYLHPKNEEEIEGGD